MNDVFTSEAQFEEAVITHLQSHGWKNGLLKNPTEAELLENWANILFENNKERDRLNGQPLTKGEMQQILEQITELRTPMRIHGFINGRTITITRDNEADELHFGKAVSLYIYDRLDIAGGRSVYQIAQQPRFSTRSAMLGQRRGDLMLLINGMPLFHVELKSSAQTVGTACNQFERYMNEGVYTGIFALAQVFVAMNPNETVYFANPGREGDFSLYRFHWGDFNNEPINHWRDVIASLLSIPMAHQLIGFYSVADGKDSALKVMRSYQYYAASAIAEKVKSSHWEKADSRGGHVWHTTGSGKTMTSFKSAQLVAASKNADKVIFLVDRIELGTQSLDEYRNFADDSQSVQATEDTAQLAARLTSNAYSDTLIVTSIQKMSRIHEEEGGIGAAALAKIQDKRLVFIVDEAHRSTFGDMMHQIRTTFPRAMFFGFTGTPIHHDNQKKKSTTADVFGDELHRYSIADGIRDRNVLGFDPYKVLTFRDKDVRKAVALHEAKAHSVEEVLADEKKREIYQRYMQELPMAGQRNEDGRVGLGVEDKLPESQYSGADGTGNLKHMNQVVADILDSWDTYSYGKFHAILATHSIPEAITYWRLFRQAAPQLKVTALFDANIDNRAGIVFKEEGLAEILEGYNALYGTAYTIPTHAQFKKDVALRLAHKEHYRGIERDKDKQLDLLIVVDQMLTGYDSKWINALYLDKVLRYENVIQAFSRTNRLFGPEKQFGMIRYYRRPHTMERNVRDALKLYSGDRELALYVPKLVKHLAEANAVFGRIASLFANAGIPDFGALPKETEARAQFARHFKELADLLECARIQGFDWNQHEYIDNETGEVVALAFDEQTFLRLAQRYKELAGQETGPGDDSDGTDPEGVPPFEIHGYLTEIDTGHIDTDYMRLNFEKWLRMLESPGASKEELDRTLAELHASFASLSTEQQGYAESVMRAAERGELAVRDGMSFLDYIAEFQAKGKDSRLIGLGEAIGVDADLLREFMARGVNEQSLNEYGRFDQLKESVDRKKARAYFEERDGEPVPPFRVPAKIDALLRNFVLSGGFDL